MSRLLDKARQKVKKKAGAVMDHLRLPPQEDRSISPALSHQIEHSVSSVSDSVPLPSAATPPGALATAPGALSSPSASTTPAVPVYAQPPSPPTILVTTGSAVKGLLAAARDGSDLFLPLKAALVGVVALWDVWDRTVEAKAEFIKLESKLVAFKAIAEAHQEEPRDVDQSLQARLQSIAQAIQGLWEAVEQKQSRGGFVRGAQSSIDLGDIKALVNAISSLLEVFQFESSIAVEKRLGLIVKRLETNKDERLAEERAKKQEKAMKTINSVLGENFVSEAADDEQPSYAGCMTGTRVGVLFKFVAWVKTDPMSIFWLAGMAGTGKTSIAVSLCRMLRKDSTVFLGGGYFCSRSAGSIVRTDVRRILPTLATLLADQSQEFAEALAAELETDRRIGHKPVAEQIDPLLRRPLDALGSLTIPIVFVIDALDECANERELAELLRLLADFECNKKVKFILTSRPEMHIRGTSISNPGNNTILHLHTIGTEEVESDIRLYISGTLQEAAPAATWYTDSDIELLVRLSGGLFIFASTVLKYVLYRDEDEDRQDRLRKATSAVATRTAATSAIDEVYKLVLTEASGSDALDGEELERMRRIMACILTARMSLSVEALAGLINVTPGRLRGSLERLHSLVYLPTENQQPGLRVLHASFGDYLFERGPEQIRVTASLGHDSLARGCMRRLAQDDLCFNIARCRSSFEPNPGTVPEWIPLDLTYACLHWAHHIDAASDRLAFVEDIGRIFRAKFLFWLEVLSVTGKLGFASGLLRIAGSVVNLPVVSQFLRDANTFVASSHTAISMSAPHIYLSALPFAAKDSLVYREFAPLCTGLVSATTTAVDRHGSRLITTLAGHESMVNSVVYSPDGRLLASGSDDGTVRIWDTRTGEESTSPLRSEGGRVLFVAFAPSGQHISAAVGRAVHVWDVTTGRVALEPLRGHDDMVRSVAYSPDSSLIASASFDKTIRIWSAETGQTIVTMTGHTAAVHAVAFSPDGRHLASASQDETVRVWNSRTGEAVGNPLMGLNDVVRSLAYSPDGKYLAAGTETIEAGVWDLLTQEPTPVVIRNQPALTSLAFSPDGSKLVLPGWQSIRFWDMHHGHELSGASLAATSGLITSVSFSPDGLFLASSSSDGPAVRIWDAASGVESTGQPLQAHTAAVSSVAVSPDGTFIVSGSGDLSVRVWDTHTGDAMLQPLLGHTGRVHAVAISSDGYCIASASEDRTVKLWDARTGKSIGELLGGHERQVRTVAFSPDDRWLASGSDDGTALVWDVATRTIATSGLLQCGQSVLVIVFSPNGQLLAAASLKGIQFWRTDQLESEHASLHANSESIYCMAFSPDSTLIVSGGLYCTIRVWDVDGRHVIFVFNGHTAPVGAIAFAPDSLHIISASDDKTVRIWDVTMGEAVVTLFGHAAGVQSIALTPDGRSIVTGGDDKTIHIWDVEAALLLPSQSEKDQIAKLGVAALNDDGWLVGSSGELLLWLPAEYRGHIVLPPCSTIIGPYRIALTANNLGNNLHWGDRWTACWRDVTRPMARSSQ